MDLFSSVRELHGVGPARAAQLEKLGIRTLYDLLAFFPRDYEDRTNPVTIAQLQPGVPACFRTMVVSQPVLRRIGGGRDITKLTVADETGKLTLSYFNQPYVKNQLHYGESYYFYGALQPEHGMQMANPAHDPADRPGAVTNRLLPVYSLTAGLSNRLMTQCVQQALTFAAELLPEILPEQVRREYDLCGVTEAYTTVHQPPDWPALQRARKRLVFEEFFIFSAGLAVLRASRTELSAAPYAADCMQGFYAALPFRLTGAQQRAIDQILQDLTSGHVMNRLVQGDVGSGKTVISVLALAKAVENGHQGCLMAPTEILAAQHYATLLDYLEPLGVRVALLTGGMRVKARRELLLNLELGLLDVVVGTHALLQEDVRFADLSVAITDEQHRFGVNQRAVLANKSQQAPDVLVMTATPIPRTLALTIYGDLDISVMKGRPPGRKQVQTLCYTEERRREVYAGLVRQVQAGRQAYVVCPLIEQSEALEARSAEQVYEELCRDFLQGIPCALLHGRLRGAEKDAIMQDFVDGKIKVLVSTTVIEVGVNVPNATLMVIENADRFGLAQLHQLRGRVGRGSEQSFCVLLTTADSPEALSRLRVLHDSDDGFYLAEQDMNQRGAGQLFGLRQHGLPDLRIADIMRDVETIAEVRKLALEQLRTPEAWQEIRRLVELQFGGRFNMIFNT